MQKNRADSAEEKLELLTKKYKNYTERSKYKHAQISE